MNDESKYFNPNKDIKIESGKLPHWSQEVVYVFITWRTADSLPAFLLKQWRTNLHQWKLQNPQPLTEEQMQQYEKGFIQPYQKLLDRGYGKCLLKNAELRRFIEQALHHYNGRDYDLQSYVIMPNHVHILWRITTLDELTKVISKIKRYTARTINKKLSIKGVFWMSNYYDRLIRSPEHLYWVQKYIADNPKQLSLKTFFI